MTESIEKVCDRDALMRDFKVWEELDKIFTDGPNNSCLKSVSPHDKYEVRRRIEMLLDRAFDAGVVFGVGKFTMRLFTKVKKEENKQCPLKNK